MDVATMKKNYRNRPDGEYRNKYDKSRDGKGETDLTPIAPQCVSREKKTLLVKCNGMIGTIGAVSGDLMHGDGKIAYDLHAKFFSPSSRRFVRDDKKNKLGQVRRMHGGYDIWYLGPMDDCKKCSVRVTSDRSMSKYRHSFSANICKGEIVIGKCKGRWLDRDFDIHLGGKLAARITKKSEDLDTDLVRNRHYWYGLVVEPGVDQVFMVLVLMALNEVSEH